MIISSLKFQKLSELKPVQQTMWNTCSGTAATLYIYNNIIVMPHSKKSQKNVRIYSLHKLCIIDFYVLKINRMAPFLNLFIKCPLYFNVQSSTSSAGIFCEELPVTSRVQQAHIKCV